MRLRPGAFPSLRFVCEGPPRSRPHPRTGDPSPMSLMLRLYSALSGRKIGTDRFGNVYFEAKRKLPVYGRARRWVLYAGAAEATTVPPEWHAWLHHTTDAPLSETKRYPWQKE